MKRGEREREREREREGGMCVCVCVAGGELTFPTMTGQSASPSAATTTRHVVIDAGRKKKGYDATVHGAKFFLTTYFF